MNTFLIHVRDGVRLGKVRLDLFGIWCLQHQEEATDTYGNFCLKCVQFYFSMCHFVFLYHFIQFNVLMTFACLVFVLYLTLNHF